MNSPIQGTAADIIKLAMVKTADGAEKERSRRRAYPAVHDELIVECAESDTEDVTKLLKNCIETRSS